MVLFGRNQTKTNPNHLEIFETFFNEWLLRQENYLQQLVQSFDHLNLQENKPRLRELIIQVMAHYNEYYEAKSRLAHADVFVVFSPPWFSSFERSFLWVAGFKPGLAFGLVTNSVSDLSEDQMQRMERLREETKEEEKELEEELARVQEEVAAPPILELARRVGQGEAVREMEAAVEKVKVAMEGLVGCADMLRTKTVLKVVEILSMPQKVRCLAAVAQFQLRIRSWGMQKDAERRNAFAH